METRPAHAKKKREERGRESRVHCDSPESLMNVFCFFCFVFVPTPLLFAGPASWPCVCAPHSLAESLRGRRAPPLCATGRTPSLSLHISGEKEDEQGKGGPRLFGIALARAPGVCQSVGAIRRGCTHTTRARGPVRAAPLIRSESSSGADQGVHAPLWIIILCVCVCPCDRVPVCVCCVIPTYHHQTPRHVAWMISNCEFCITAEQDSDVTPCAQKDQYGFDRGHIDEGRLMP